MSISDPELFARTRREYRRGVLEEQSLPIDPFELFESWYREVLDTNPVDPNAMALTTVSVAGRPSLRMVLLKGVAPEGFTFFTSFGSRKGRELSENPFAAILFYWPEFERQIRIEGRVTRAPAHVADSYFESRPRSAQLAAAVSKQSQSIEGGRAQLEEEYRSLEAASEGRPVPRPEQWGGYTLSPHRFEFWQGRESRLHDRIVYLRSKGGSEWARERLYP